MIKIYNTLTQQKEVFVPLNAKQVKLYACGVTVYDYCHLGHARTYTAIDVIVRYLTYCGFKVDYVRNITDIDDKIIKRALENNENITDLTARFIHAMQKDFAALNLLPPTHEPRATEYIKEMQDLIATLLAKKHAYLAANQDIYFDIQSFKQYGQLSRQSLKQLASGIRVLINEEKHDPLDFILWKAAKPNEPAWDSPWGLGRPGWHIECSAMAIALLGETFDIHAGGRDLIFPHHENEIAQSQAGCAAGFAKIWLHTGFLQMEKEKMSKSLGNVITIREVLTLYHPEVLRYFLLANHYRSPLVYSAQNLSQAQGALSRLYTALRFFAGESSSLLPESGEMYQQKFIAAMEDDFNVPIALSVLFELAHEIQRLREKERDAALALAQLLKKLGGILGILLEDPEIFFKSGEDVDPNLINDLVLARDQARLNKNWQEADRIREELAKLNITIEDTPTGTIWKYHK